MKKYLQSNLLMWFYVSFLHRLGFYLIEMNSGRLRGGAQNFGKSLALGIFRIFQTATLNTIECRNF